MKLSQEEQDQIIDFGALGYDPHRIAVLLSISEKNLIEEFDNENSDINKLYKKGVYLAEYKIDLKLFEMAT